MPNSRVNSVQRALTILASFEQFPGGATLQEIANRTELHKTTALRLCNELMKNNFLKRTSDGRFHIGGAMWRLGKLFERGIDVADIVRPVLATLVDLTGDPSALYVRSGDRRVCLFRQTPKDAPRQDVEEGMHLPLEKGVGGQILLAFSGAKGSDFSAIRENGYLVSLGDWGEDFYSVAVPVFASGQLFGSLAVFGFHSHTDDDFIRSRVKLMRDTANSLSQELSERWEGGNQVSR